MISLYRFFRYAALIVLGFSVGRTAPAAPASADVVIYGTTPGGVACAVRAAREGMSVIMISYHDQIGGMLTSGLGVWDTLYEGYRAPLYNELRQSLFDYYRLNYGEDSQSYLDARPGKRGHNNGTFEAHVAEKLITAMVEAEPNITVIYNHYPVAVTATKGEISSLTLQLMDGETRIEVAGDYFADCSYEGDLMAVAGVNYRIGREARSEYNEEHAGVIYMMPQRERMNPESRRTRVLDGLNIRHFGGDQKIIYPDSTHEADDIPQAFNMRYYITQDPTNQVKLTPSADYDPDLLATLEFYFPPREIKPNGKRGTNRPQLVGLHQTYVEGDWATRRHVVNEHIRMTRDMIYWLTEDPSAPADRRERAKGWGLAADEWVDNDNNPYDIYVREARRLVGRYVYTENDLDLHDHYDRAPVHADSIGIVEWYMDAHASTLRKSDQGGLHEGKMMLHKETFVGQLPYRSILPREFNNLIVPVPLSATHVAWGAVRLEPTWMQIGESAAYAMRQAQQEQVALADIDTGVLVRRLAESRSLVTFFNDFYIDEAATWIPAVQYFGTQGFFPSYDARPLAPVSTETLAAWVNAIVALQAGTNDAEALAIKLAATPASPNANYQDFRNLITKANLSLSPNLRSHEVTCPVTRAAACELLWDYLR